MTSNQSPAGVVEAREFVAAGVERADRARHLLDDIAHRTECARKVRIGKVHALLDHPVLRDDLTRRRVRRQLTAERFNVFDALWIERREIYHSRLLAYLLDPRQFHDQGAVFLKAVVESIGRKIEGAESAEWVGSLDCASCRVTAEQYAEEYGRIDLVLEFRCGTRIAIENKVDHVERTNQLPDYRRWLDKASAAGKARQILVFLTPDERESVDACGEYVRMSYRDLADALATGAGECSPTTIPLLAVLQQYIQLCRRLAVGGADMADQSKEILEVLRDPEKLAVALDVEMHLTTLKEDVKTEFRARVAKRLGELLIEKSVPEAWVAGVREGWREYVCIRRRSDIRHGSDSSNYSCGAGLYFTWASEGGWYRPIRKSPAINPAIK